MTNAVLGFPELVAAQSQPEVQVNFADRALTLALGGQITIELTADANLTLAANTPPLSTDQWAYAVIRITDSPATLTAARDVIYPAVDTLYTGPSRLVHLFINETAQTLTFKRSGQTGVTVPAGQFRLVRHNGTDIELLSARWAADPVTWTGVLSPAQITANQNDYNPSGLSVANVLRLSTDASRTITGIVPPRDGAALRVFNVGAQDLVLSNQDAASAAANRLALGASVTLGADEGCTLWYDPTSTRWRMAGKHV